MNADRRPLLIYDGDCSFCTWWVRRWHSHTGDAVDYRPWQEEAQRYPDLAPGDFREAVRWFGPDGSRAAGAEATFRVLAQAPGKGFWLAAYRHVPGFAWLSERAYAFVARRRALAGRVTRLLWGEEPAPPRHDLTVAVFLRALALVYLAAFASFGVQVRGLVGSQGILPLGEYLELLARHGGGASWWQAPTLFWLTASDAALDAACWGGVLASLALLLRLLPRIALALAFVLYLSLFHAGQVFTNFQWDLLLLETGFLGLLLAGGSRAALWGARWLLARFMFMSGAVKLLSGDPHWADLSALQFHFQTQPLPSPLAWSFHQLPEWALAFLAGAHFFVELVLPLMVFMPRRPRLLAAAGFALLQLFIVATGNYGFFNLLVLALIVLLLDDRALAPLARLGRPGLWARPGRLWGGFAAGFVAVAVAVSGAQMLAALTRSSAPAWLAAAQEALGSWALINRYGVFAVITTERPEIVIEGSADGAEWREYRLPFKPGDPGRAPGWNIPHQPRLDWQMWFAAQGTHVQHPWVGRLLLRLLEGSPPVRALFADDPFAGAPPQQVRALLYDYRFADAGERAAGSPFWVRRQTGIYVPALSLAPPQPQPAAAPGLFDALVRPRE